MRAVEARAASYSPYSRFRVGCAIRASAGQIYTGANLDNASYPVSVCAEKSAVSAAVTAGERRLAAVAVAGDADSVAPCGACRQLLAELGGPETTVTYRWQGDLVTASLGELLPHAFQLGALETPP
jgi:cytidine deaminase